MRGSRSTAWEPIPGGRVASKELLRRSSNSRRESSNQPMVLLDSRIFASHVRITSAFVVAARSAWKPSRILRSFAIREWSVAILPLKSCADCGESGQRTAALAQASPGRNDETDSPTSFPARSAAC